MTPRKVLLTVFTASAILVNPFAITASQAAGPLRIRQALRHCNKVYEGPLEEGQRELCYDRVWEKCLDILTPSECGRIFEEENVDPFPF